MDKELILFIEISGIFCMIVGVLGLLRFGEKHGDKEQTSEEQNPRPALLKIGCGIAIILCGVLVQKLLGL